ncbi:MAG: type II 3-dehydroquinate dehydratase [Pseudomonadota bacterium]|nr:type II 3-dehydroquinate dehydratase [Pseudomonadota bacterium]
MTKILLINGPNLNLLGSREPDVYGKENLKNIENLLMDRARESGVELNCFQSNAEHEIVEKIQESKTIKTRFILINPGAFTHTSIAIRDAILAVDIPFYEIHLSNTFARENFRHKSYFSDIATGCIFGLGAYGYELALKAAIKIIETS